MSFCNPHIWKVYLTCCDDVWTAGGLLDGSVGKDEVGRTERHSKPMFIVGIIVDD